jgi:hypothetical protein
VFAVNVWNCVLVMMWHGEGEGGDASGDCPDIAGVATPSWLAWIDSSDEFQLNQAIEECRAQVLDRWVFLVFMAMFAVVDCILFLPALLQRRQQKSLKEIVTEDREFLEKRARLSRSISRASTKANIMARSQTELVD